MFDGRIISLLIHVPIAPPDAFMRLYRLHPFPLPFDNGTLLTHNVKNEILAISNSNHRYTLQMSTVDLLGCHRLGKLHLCERNGLLNKYPEDTCLGSLYHQKFDIAHQLCNFRVEPAREFIYQLLNNWFMVFEPSPLTVPVVCATGHTLSSMSGVGSPSSTSPRAAPPTFPAIDYYPTFLFLFPRTIFSLKWIGIRCHSYRVCVSSSFRRYESLDGWELQPPPWPRYNLWWPHV